MYSSLLCRPFVKVKMLIYDLFNTSTGLKQASQNKHQLVGSYRKNNLKYQLVFKYILTNEFISTFFCFGYKYIS